MTAARDTTGVVQSLMHGTAVLDMFGHGRSSVTVAEIATQLGVHRSSASRLAMTLARAGYLSPVTGRQGSYQLGSKLIALGDLARGNRDLLDAAAAPMAELSAALGDTVHLGILDGFQAVTISVIDGTHALRMHSYVGKRSPAHCSSMGKVLLAALNDETIDGLLEGIELEAKTSRTITATSALRLALEKTRDDGFAVDSGELEEGLCCVAAPVSDRAGLVVASLSVSGPGSRLTDEAIPAVARQVMSAAREAGGNLR